MPFNKKVLLGGALAVSIAATGFTFNQLSQPSYVTMMTDLDPVSMQSIIPLLEAEGIPFTVAPNNSTLLVDRDSVQIATNVLAKNGLPAKPMAGYDHLNNSNSPYITKSTEEQISRQVLEENLAASILQIEAVDAAVVRLAVAKNSQFLRDVEPTTASVVLTLKRGMSLNRAQITGIVKMIAFSVPNLPEENVIILDSTGRALSKGNDAVMGNGNTASELKETIEYQLRQKIVEVVAPIVGLDDVRVNVEADINFDKVENTKEEPVETTVILSQQIEKSFDPELAGGGGVVGAVVNQPPEHTSFDEKPKNQTADTSEDGVSHIKETTNFSVGKSITHTVQSVGKIQKVNVAILFDQKELTAAEITALTDTITSLAQSSIGFDQARGDTIDVRAMNFVDAEVAVVEPTPIYETKIAKDAIEAGKWMGALLLVWLLFWRPLVKALGKGSRRDEETDEMVADSAISTDADDMTVSSTLSTEATEAEFELEVAKAIEIMKEKPVESQNVLRGWVANLSLEDLMNLEEEEQGEDEESEKVAENEGDNKENENDKQQ
ncbi:flagellar basal-body MS-ring/collar protein FliF [Vibrio coralliirubri]|uniref:flagellar basal-body MS-ring/collar protein FliF n=1 Tax=Vibrio coralliirubri TaxID=1516159 RepID=UPI0022843461|nr:flagellar basal-body MS-ring/collar protein FliF [Vibrio coralliirubri]MCY9860979.1 flagellar basal-body MS-ring/collar protein FliF [Vibrio coralliirubri]